MSDFFGKLKSGAGKVAFEADKMNRLNHAKGDLEKIKSQVQAQYTKLGELYFMQRTTMGVTGPAYDDICQAILDLGHQGEAKSDEIQRITAENYVAPGTQPAAPQPSYSAPVQPPQSVPTQFPTTQAPTQFNPPPAQVQNAAATKFCPNCGKEMAVTVKFCPDCGTKV